MREFYPLLILGAVLGGIVVAIVLILGILVEVKGRGERGGTGCALGEQAVGIMLASAGLGELHLDEECLSLFAGFEGLGVQFLDAIDPKLGKGILVIFVGVLCAGEVGLSQFLYIFGTVAECKACHEGEEEVAYFHKVSFF